MANGTITRTEFAARYQTTGVILAATTATQQGSNETNNQKGITDQVYGAANVTQVSSLASAVAINDKLDDTLAIATATAAEMEAQTEILNNAKLSTEEIKSDLKLASRQLSIFLRRVMTDKVILVLSVLIVAVVTAVIIYVCVKPKHHNTRWYF